MEKTCALIGAPIQSGASQPGCLMGPASLRTAGLAAALTGLGWTVTDLGDIAIDEPTPTDHSNRAIKRLAETAAWIGAVEKAAFDAAGNYDFPIFLGGDHSMSAGSVAGLARHAAQGEGPLFVLWLDAHPDLHTLESTESGHLHGTSVAYFTGRPDCEGYPPLAVPVPPEQVCFMGLRSVDDAERRRIASDGFEAYDMRAIDEMGVLSPLRTFLDRVIAANGILHVSLDVDFLDPSIAPAVGTTVPGGATFREAHLIMETLHDSGLVRSLDLVELNPFLDERGRTAELMTDLAASLFGRHIFDRPTRSMR
ncbi:arginase [Notoacmeibacter sp. MSK16QG-6]|uniref:arginase n=1 Tax=Notoacmeibacter sp. MSK16QG-6 TaxID=2957982 RepID=UPI00209F6024|nr:arginase [Notoacmeibacter sp. MSK16QG-6]MCP1199037.1 arginase [Notoacmeibacter sp. MSK16QG-6]